MDTQVPDHHLVHRISVGSYGEVWLARSALGAWRAVKIVKLSRFQDARPYEREYKGVTEYEPASRDHEHLVDILHVGRNDDVGCFYYVMELADPWRARSPTGTDSQAAPAQGPPAGFDPDTYQPHTLDVELKQRGRFSVPECVAVGIALAQALDFLHQRRLVHRDVKLANVIYVKGVPKLADIGLVTHVDRAQTRVGTEGYFPPEGPGTPSADLFGLGKVLYELSTGCDRMEFPELPTLSGDPAEDSRLLEFNQIVIRACQPDPGKRYRSAREMREELALLAAGGSVVGKRRARRRAVSIAWAAAGIVLALVCFRALMGRGPGTTRDSPFSDPRIVDWTGAVFAQLDGFPGLEVAIPCERTNLLVFNGKGDQRYEVKGLAPADTHFGITVVHDLSGDGKDALFAFWTRQTNLVIHAADPFSSRHGRYQSFGLPAARGLSTMIGVGLVSLGDGRRNLISSLNTGYGPPRGLLCHDFDTRSELWPFDVAPTPNPCEFLDLTGDNVPDILLGSAAPCNGYQLPDGTDDSHSYVYAISSAGSLLWRVETGDHHTSCHVTAAELNAAGRKEILVRVSSLFDYRQDKTPPEPARLLILDLAGKTQAQYDGQFNFEAATVGDLDGDGKPEILAADRKGFLHVLDAGLHLWRRVPVAPARFFSSRLETLILADLDRDGANEVVLGCVQEERLEKHSGNPNRPPPPTLYHDAEVLVLDHNLRPMVRHLVAKEASNTHPFKLRVLDLFWDGRPKVVVLSDDVKVFELRQAQDRRWLQRLVPPS